MVDAINYWINNGCNYIEGLGLYDRYGTNAFFKKILKAGETASNRQKLNELLVNLRDQAKPHHLPVNKVPTVAGKLAAVAPAPDQARIEPPAKALPELLLVTKLRDQTINEIRQLHPHLDSTAEGADLLELAKRVVQLGKKNAEHWQRYNHLLEHGEDPVLSAAPPKPPVLIDLHLLEEKERIRKSLNKAENRIKGIDKPKQKTLDLIAAKKQELADINARIANIRKGKAK